MQQNSIFSCITRIENHFLSFCFKPKNQIDLTKENLGQSILSFVLIIFLQIPITTFAQSHLKFNQISVDDGLSNTAVNSMIQDSQGYMWFGTQGGLNRYDGYSFKTYQYQSGDTTSIANNICFWLYEDRNQNLWAGTYGGGLSKFDPVTETFKNYQHDTNDPYSISSDIVTTIEEDQNGDLWLGTRGGGLNKFDLTEEKFTHFKHDDNNPESISSNSVYDIYIDEDGTFWVSTNQGLNEFDTLTQKFVSYKPDPNDPESISSFFAFYMYADQENTIWVGSYNGLNRFDKKTKKFTHFSYNIENNQGLSGTRPWWVYGDSQDRVWIGDWNAGLNRYDRDRNQFDYFLFDKENPNSISGNSIRHIYEDSNHNIWVGTALNGVNMTPPHSDVFHHYFHKTNEEQSLSDNTIRSIFKDSSGELWVATYGGLDWWKEKDFEGGKNIFSHYQHDTNNENSLAGNRVYAICEDQKGNLWIGTQGAGISMLPVAEREKENPNFQKFVYDAQNPNGLSSNDILWLYASKDGNSLWIATHSGFNVMNLETYEIEVYVSDTQESKKQISSKQVWHLLEDSNGFLWVGTSNGLNKINPNTHEVQVFYNDMADINTLSSSYILSVFEDSQHQLWVATLGGLNLFDSQSNSFIRYGQKEGLTNGTVYGILEDDHNNLWMSSNEGIYKFDKAQKKATRYDIEDGLQNNEFNRTSFFKDKETGMMYFGGSQGLTVFHPDSVKEHTIPPKVVINNFLYFNQEVPILPQYNAEEGRSLAKHTEDDKMVYSLARSINHTEELILEYQDYIFGFEFAALNYVQPKKNQYQYKLEGFDKDWITTDYLHRRATYTNIPAGTYIFRVKASNDDGYWNNEGASIRVVILPPWWWTWWAKTLWVTLFVGTLLFIYFFRVKTLKAQKEKLEVEVERQTLELRERNEEISLQKEEMEVQADELKNTNNRLVSLSAYKEVFTGMIVHDLKNPLNSIIGLSEGEFSAQHQEKINQSGKSMLNLVLNILEVQKLEEATTNLDLKSTSLRNLSLKALQEVRLLYQEKSLQINCNVDENIWVEVDENLMLRVLVNLLTNAIKYTPLNGAIHLYHSKPELTQKESSITFYVNDTGTGIPKSKQTDIFKKFGQVKSKNSGRVRSTGLGLTFCKMAVEAHNQQVGVESEEGKGATFWFTVKLSEVNSTEVLEPITNNKIETIAETFSLNINIKLTSEEANTLEPFVEKMRKFEVYELSDVKDILNQIPQQNSKNIESWCAQMQETLYAGNEEKYELLIELVA